MVNFDELIPGPGLPEEAQIQLEQSQTRLDNFQFCHFVRPLRLFLGSCARVDIVERSSFINREMLDDEPTIWFDCNRVLSHENIILPQNLLIDFRQYRQSYAFPLKALEVILLVFQQFARNRQQQKREVNSNMTGMFWILQQQLAQDTDDVIDVS